MKYIVTGTTGEYSDTSIWHVQVFDTESEANDFAGKLNNWCRENNVDWRDVGKHYRALNELRLTNPYDPEFGCLTTGTKYGVIPVKYGD